MPAVTPAANTMFPSATTRSCGGDPEPLGNAARRPLPLLRQRPIRRPAPPEQPGGAANERTRAHRKQASRCGRLVADPGEYFLVVHQRLLTEPTRHVQGDSRRCDGFEPPVGPCHRIGAGGRKPPSRTRNPRRTARAVLSAPGRSRPSPPAERRARAAGGPSPFSILQRRSDQRQNDDRGRDDDARCRRIDGDVADTPERECPHHRMPGDGEDAACLGGHRG